eukprot:CAMPEP_0171997982 /NCGR_PEP_ID=MMETSP1041-20130122/988_1 /TAXON_ID=464988 /ORGANISM="Hemiselmis andersenii, Strain CCMP439" /LENGTH=220 /DNA_ID=CAMNT_0012651315 /DNA_START=79 /DNA_END=738 /DNA_ORIENTATION=+
MVLAQPRPKSLHHDDPAVPRLQKNPMWPALWNKRLGSTHAEDIMEDMHMNLEAAMMDMLEEEADREAKREIMMRSVDSEDDRMKLEKRFTAERSKATKEVLGMASRQDRLLRQRSSQFGLNDDKWNPQPNHLHPSSFEFRPGRSAGGPGGAETLTLIDDRPVPQPVTRSQLEEQVLLLAAAKATQRSVSVAGYYPSKTLQSPYTGTQRFVSHDEPPRAAT